MNVKRIAIVGIMLMLLSFSNTMTYSYEKAESGNFIDESNDGRTLYVGGGGPNNYTKIQDAINDAEDGDTVMVYPGIYKENMVVYKSLKIIGIGYPAILPEDVNKSTVKIVNEECTIKGFNITGSNTGIKLLSDARKCQIENNIFYNNLYSGIYIDNAWESIISNNIFKNEGYCGIYIAWGNNISVINNTFISTGHGIDGEGVGCVIAKNTFFEGDSAIHIDSLLSQDFEIYGNKIEKYECGISIIGHSHKIYHNEILYNNEGIFYCGIVLSKTEIYENNISYNMRGMGLMNVIGNLRICKNNFVGNDVHAEFSDSYFIFWLNNYWDDWSIPLPKPVYGRIIGTMIPWIQFDWHPLMQPYEWWKE